MKTLLDVISRISEYDKVKVYKDDKLVTYYDGKNSIDENRNADLVKSVKRSGKRWVITLA